MGDVLPFVAPAPDAPKEVYLARMIGGPAAGDHTLTSFDWTWPLPAWLEVPDPGAAGRRRPLGRYVKVSESQITDEQMASMTHVMRGAQYVWEPIEVDVGPPPSTIQKGHNQ